MAFAIQHYKGNRSPSLTDTLKIDNVVFDLTGSTVKFRMRAVGSSVLKVDTAATIVSPTAGTVRYDWASGDVDTAGDFLGWWQVTLASGKLQDTPEFLLTILDHVPAAPSLYVDVEELKDTLVLTGQSFADESIADALSASSRAIDLFCDRRFYPDADAAQVRYYTPDDWRVLFVDDVLTITTLKTDPGGDGVFEQTWATTDYTHEPLNAAADGNPWTFLRANPAGTLYFPAGVPRSVELTGKFGWLTVPPPIKQATTILANRLLKRAREVPFGVAGMGLDGSAVRITSTDPDVVALISPYRTLNVR